jgi:predicted enzyme related to lactoylglutathione lyase
MEVQPLLVIVHSEDPDRLIAFYDEVVDLVPRFDLAPGGFAVGLDAPISLIVEGHSEVHGSAKEPQRVMLNFSVDDAASEARRIADRGVTFIREPYEEPGVAMFATFTDPDGDYCQLLQLYGER